MNTSFLQNGYSGYNAKISYGNGCDGACGINANCAMRDIEPICSCPENCIGDPKTYCKPYVKGKCKACKAIYIKISTIIL